MRERTAALEESYNFTRQIAATTPVAVYLFDLDEMRTVYTNGKPCVFQAFASAVDAGESPQSVTLLDLLHPEDQPLFADVSQRFLTQHKSTTPAAVETEYRLRRPNGEWRWFRSTEIVFRRTAEGYPQQILGAAQDVTGHKRSEQALRASERRYRDLFENANDALATVTLDGLLTSVNRATEILLGWQREDMQGMPLQTYLTPNSATRVQEQHCRAIEREARSSSFELEFVRKDGSLVQVESRVQLISETTGAPVGLQAAYRDITERKQAETQRQALNAQLVETSRQAGMAEVATHVLHNVGNVLNSVNVATGVLIHTVRQSRLGRVGQIGSMIQQHKQELAHYLAQDPKGQQIPTYLTQLGKTLVREQTATLKELEGLNQNLDHIKQIIGLQQDIAKVSVPKKTVMVLACTAAF